MMERNLWPDCFINMLIYTLCRRIAWNLIFSSFFLHGFMISWAAVFVSQWCWDGSIETALLNLRSLKWNASITSALVGGTHAKEITGESRRLYLGKNPTIYLQFTNSKLVLVEIFFSKHFLGFYVFPAQHIKVLRKLKLCCVLHSWSICQLVCDGCSVNKVV